MRYVQQQDESLAGPEPAALIAKFLDSSSFNVDDPTVDCYSRRSRILTETNKAEWWVAIAVLLMIAGMGFVAI
jgi:hypothetical protein